MPNIITASYEILEYPENPLLSIERAARTCYKSEDKITQGSAEVLVKKLLESGHHAMIEFGGWIVVKFYSNRGFCYTPDTKVLTLSGWKYVTEVELNDSLLTMNPQTHRARWSTILSLHEFDYQGDIYFWETSQIKSPKMTANHILWTAPYDLRRARGLSSRKNMDLYAEKIPARDIFGRRFAIDHLIQLENPLQEETIQIGDHKYYLDDLVEWLGWLATDGGFDKDRPNKCTISQSKQENFPQIERVMNALFHDRWKTNGPYEEHGLKTFKISDKNLADWARSAIGPNKAERKFSSWVLELPNHLINRLLQSAIVGDGTTHKNNGHQCLYCPTLSNAEQWLTIIAMAGFTGNIREDNRIGKKHSLPNGVQISQTKSSYVIDISRKSASLVKLEHQRVERYEGKTYCPRTADGLIFVKREGQPIWAGNTHELVRHRVSSLAQESTRYCNYSKNKFGGEVTYIDPSAILELKIKDVEKRALYKSMLLEAWAQSEGNYLALVGAGCPAEISREALCIGTKAEIVIGANTREWLHILDLRTSKKAHPRMREVMIPLLRDFQNRTPILFDSVLPEEEHSDAHLI